MILKETLDLLTRDIKKGKIDHRALLNLLKEYRKIADWEETSFKEVDEVIAATGELSAFINVAQGFPHSTIEGLKLCGVLGQEVQEMRGKALKDGIDLKESNEALKKAKKEVEQVKRELKSERRKFKVDRSRFNAELKKARKTSKEEGL